MQKSTREVLSLSVFLFFFSLYPAYAEDNDTDFNATKTQINQLQAVDPTLPSGVSQPKGVIGDILAKMFNSDGKIGTRYLSIFPVGSSTINSAFINGTTITNLNANNITNGTINSARLPNDIVRTTGNQSIGGIKTFTNNPNIQNSSPMSYYLDTDNRSAMMHVNNNQFYLLRGSGNGATTWSQFNGFWPLQVNLENNDVFFGGNVGIGTLTPSAKLDVNGVVKSTGLQINGTSSYNSTTLASTYNHTMSLGTFPISYTIYNSYDGGYWGNLFIGGAGMWSGQRTTMNGQFNQSVGGTALANMGTGTSNNVFGWGSFKDMTTGSQNTAMGRDTGYNVTSGNNNSFFGAFAGRDLVTGNNNIAIGYSAQLPSTSASNQLSIGNWIYGNNGNIGIGTISPGAKLTVGENLDGNAHSNTFKTNAGNLPGTLNSELALASIGFTSGNQIALGIKAIRAQIGTDWNTVAVGVGMDVDDTSRTGGSFWLHANGNIGVNTINPTEKLDVAGNIRTTGTFIGNGSTITNINASNITSGTLTGAVLPNTVVLTSGNQTIGGVKTFTSYLTTPSYFTAGGYISSNSYITAQGYIQSNSYLSTTGYINAGSYITSSGTVTANGGFIGNGLGITNLNASNITNGTINSARLPSDIVRTTGDQTIGGIKTFTNNTNIQNTSPTTYYLDTDNRSAMIHVNSNQLYVLRGSSNGSTTWTSFNGFWPLQINLENNNAIFGGDVGIGTSAPSAKLHVNGNIIASTPTASNHVATKGYVDGILSVNPIGVNQTWQNVLGSRTHSTSYQNTTGRPIMVSIVSGGANIAIQVSSDNINWVNVGIAGNYYAGNAGFIVPNNHYYRVSSNPGSGIVQWSELR